MLLNMDTKGSRQFVLLCLSHFMFSCSFNMPIPELPAYLSSLGGEQYIGLIISLFTLMAGLSRPFSGKLADRIGRIPVMIYGSLVCVVCSLLYPVLTSVSGFLLLRFFHGFSTGFKPTGANAYVADIAPIERRGQALGVLGLFNTMGLSLGPALGSYASDRYGMHAMFMVSSAMALISVIILSGMKETLPEKESFRLSSLKLKRDELIEPRALSPALITFLLYAGYGAALTIVPELSDRVGLSNRGLFFSFFTLSSVGIRVVAGKLPDRIGRIPVLKLASGIMLASMLMIAWSASPLWLLLAGLVYGLSMGMTSPSTAAWTVDTSHPDKRGRALATMFIAMESGIGLGALASGWWYERSGHDGFSTFVAMALLSLLAFIYLQWLFPWLQAKGYQELPQMGSLPGVVPEQD